MRIRTIKPEFFTHHELFLAEKEFKLPLRIAFIGLWSAADREGRFKWRPQELGVKILPYDSVNFSRVLNALLTRGFVCKYEFHNKFFGAIPTWHSHQVINNRETRSKLPEPPQDIDFIKQSSINVSPELRRQIFERDQYKCKICSNLEDLTIAHMEPRVFGQDDSLDNLQVLCRSCNTIKGSTRPARVTDILKHAQGEGKGREGNKLYARVSDASFLDFWFLYPKKRAKADAFKIWQSIKPNKELYDKIITNLKIQINSPEWQKDNGAFIPWPAKWLKQARWDDETEVNLFVKPKAKEGGGFGEWLEKPKLKEVANASGNGATDTTRDKPELGAGASSEQTNSKNDDRTFPRVVGT
jgi:5-methylcytosine-specific restriction endonuclease McrA